MADVQKNTLSENNNSPWTIFLAFLHLGLTSFGGPIAHIGYFRNEFVGRRRWLSESSYADLVALCQFLPGPASSQVGLAIGFSRSGFKGALAAWLGFTLPSAIVLILFALSITHYGEVVSQGMLHGLKIVAVAVVTQAVWGMAKNLCPDAPRITLMAMAASAVLLVPVAWMQFFVIVVAGVLGVMFLKPEKKFTADSFPLVSSRRSGVIWLSGFFILLFGLPVLSQWSDSPALEQFSAFFRSGSLVFGGGHVVLPLLQADVVPTGLVDNETFLAGYGAAQAVPGPLFTFAGFLGASMNQSPTGWAGGLLCLVAIFAPSFMLVAGALPFWNQLRQNALAQTSLSGVNAAVVGLLLAALYQPVWTSAIFSALDFVLALLALIALMTWKLPPWLVVLCSGVAGWLVL